MNWQIELLTSPAIRIVIAVVLVALPVLAYAAARLRRHLWRRAAAMLHLPGADWPTGDRRA